MQSRSKVSPIRKQVCWQGWSSRTPACSPRFSTFSPPNSKRSSAISNEGRAHSHRRANKGAITVTHRLEITCAAVDGGAETVAPHSLGLTRKTTTVQATAQMVVEAVRKWRECPATGGHFMEAYIGVNEKFGSGDEDTNQRKFEWVTGDSFALELAYREIAELKDKLAQEKLYLEDEVRGDIDFEGIVGQSAALRHVLKLVETVASSDSTVLLLGETGTGKELIARAIHERSQRSERILVKLNCAAIPTGLLESELFGHERGAFTGAIAQKIGRLELADRGSLFLDEVGDIPFEVQPKLLRALQEREFERLGSNHTKKVDVRLVAATNRDLEKMMESREFRSDLYYRLNVFPIRIPPLRERPEDIPLLVRYFTQKYGRRMQKQIESISAAAMRRLLNWYWPGNIRELENFIERSVILTRGTALQAPIAELGNSGRNTPVSVRYEADRDEIVCRLRDTSGRVGGPDGAAARMGMKRTTLISRMKKLGIDARKIS